MYRCIAKIRQYARIVAKDEMHTDNKTKSNEFVRNILHDLHVFISVLAQAATSIQKNAFGHCW